MKRDRQTIAGASYAIKAYNLKPWHIAEFWDDIVQSAEIGRLDSNDSPRNAASRFIHKQILKRGLTGGSGAGRRLLDRDQYQLHLETSALPRVPVIALARLLYRMLKMKPGKRRRHSAALKALVLADRCDGIVFDVIAEKYSISTDNAKKHYRMAWTLLRHWFTQNAVMLSSKQLELFQSCTRKDVRNVTKRGDKYYDYSRRFET